MSERKAEAEAEPVFVYDYTGVSLAMIKAFPFFAVAMVRNEIPVLADGAKSRGGNLLSKVSPFLPHTTLFCISPPYSISTLITNHCLMPTCDSGPY